MQKKIISLAIAGAVLSPLAFAEDAPPADPLSFNVGVVSDYLFRGISQTHGKPALQGGVDYAFSNGFYVGAWASTITWVKDWLGSGSTEIDVYGGYKGAFANPDFTYDVGYITYNYPGHGSESPTFLANPNTQELYASIGYKWISAKYSYTTSKHFVGWYGGTGYDQDTRGSDYLELNANYDMGNGWTLIGHVGHQKVKNSVAVGGVSDANYNDWKIGVSKDVGFGVVTAYYSDTDTSGSCPSGGGGTNAYCWGTGGTTGVAPTGNYRDVSKGTAVLSFVKTF
jgi:uncharacterized protein (TIGR02001 family)